MKEPLGAGGKIIFLSAKILAPQCRFQPWSSNVFSHNITHGRFEPVFATPSLVPSNHATHFKQLLL